MIPLIRSRKILEKALYPFRWDRTRIVRIEGRILLTMKHHCLVVKGKETRGMTSINSISWNEEAPQGMRSTFISIATKEWITRTHSPKLAAPCNWKEWIRSQETSVVATKIANLKDTTLANIFITLFSIRNTKRKCCKSNTRQLTIIRLLKSFLTKGPSLKDLLNSRITSLRIKYLQRCLWPHHSTLAKKTLGIHSWGSRGHLAMELPKTMLMYLRESSKVNSSASIVHHQAITRLRNQTSERPCTSRRHSPG